MRNFKQHRNEQSPDEVCERRCGTLNSIGTNRAQMNFRTWNMAGNTSVTRGLGEEMRDFYKSRMQIGGENEEDEEKECIDFCRFASDAGGGPGECLRLPGD